MKDIEVIGLIARIIENSRIEADKALNGESNDFYIENIQNHKDNTNLIYKSDNIYAIKDLIDKGYKSKIDLIYIDPPFFSEKNYTHRIEVLYEGKKRALEVFGFSDVWTKGFKEYLEMMSLRLFLMKDLLSDKGTIYVHLDYRTVHYIKIIMDCIFGKDYFLNEIIWSYKSGGTSNKYFSRKHDNILVYTKSKDYIFNPQKEKSYNRGFKPYRFKNVKEYEDEQGWYTLVNLKDVWNINMVGRTSGERVGYRTQKPENLLERVITSSSNEDSIVADFFAGSGTMAVVAERYRRNWIISDSGDISSCIIRKRLAKESARPYSILNMSEFKYDERLILETEKELYEGFFKYSFRFKGFIFDMNSVKLNKKNRILLENIVESDPLTLIDYVGIGYLNTTNEILIQYEEFRSDDKLIINTDIEVELIHDRDVVIKVNDVFGNEFIQKI